MRSPEDYMLPCLNKKLFGFDCLGCGLQRSLSLLFHGDFLGALKMYPAVYTLIPLGLIIAAPSARNQEKDFVVYKEGSKELEANPKWAGEDGNATVGSITKFYRGDE